MKVSKQNFIYTLSRIRHQAHSFLEEEMRRECIGEIAPSFGDVFVIAAVMGPMPMKEIARHTYKDKSTITGAVKSLEKHGYLKRVKDPADGRASLVSPTAKALKTMEKFRAISDRMNARLFADLSDGQLEALFSMLEKISGSMKAPEAPGRVKGHTKSGG